MRIIVVSDTHSMQGEDLPKEFLRACAGADLVLHAGDITSDAILDTIKKINPALVAVCGNMDPLSLKKGLAEKEIIEVPPFRIGLTHGSGAPFNLIDYVKEKFIKDKVDCIVFGHSHTPYNEYHQGILLFNPGSLLDKFFSPYNSYGVLEVDKKITSTIVKI
ncbi:MAG: metallophosphoesterase family protein [Candidatus Omnitrophota bacterium]